MFEGLKRMNLARRKYLWNNHVIAFDRQLLFGAFCVQMEILW